MSKMCSYLSALLLTAGIFSPAFSQFGHFPKVLFANAPTAGPYYFSDLTYTGDNWIQTIGGKLPVTDSVAFTPGNSFELHYRSAEKGNWQALLRYEEIRGVDHFEMADHLSCWLLLCPGTDSKALPLVSLLVGESRSASVPLARYLDMSRPGQWTRVLIPLTAFEIADLRMEAIGGLYFCRGATDEGEQRLFIDQVEFIDRSEKAGSLPTPQLRNVTCFEKHFDVEWAPVNDRQVRYIKIYRAVGDESFEPAGIQLPSIPGYTDYTGFRDQPVRYKLSFLDQNYRESGFSEVKSGQTRRMNDEALLDMVQQAHLRYYWDGAEPFSGMALENIPGRQHMIATGASGFGLMALIAGVHRGFIPREEAVERFLKITGFLLNADRFHGAFPHFLDGRTGKTIAFFGPRDNGGDLVETSFLMQGLITARQFFDRDDPDEATIRTRINTLWEEVEWDWYTSSRKDWAGLVWHWSPDQEWVINHHLIGWNETMITYFLAIASPTHAIPASFYYSGWASQSEEAQAYRADWGQTKDGALYRNGNSYYGIRLPVGVGNGGPLFFIHYSFLGLNPKMLTDKYVNYFDNNRSIAKINQRYCIENPEGHQGYGADFWGLTASDGPEHYAANEPKPDQDDGKMTPTGALASFPYLPAASMDALKKYYNDYGDFLLGYYGFRDALNLDINWTAPIDMGLNQAPIVVMIENYRSGYLWDLFMAAPEVQNGLDKLGFSYE